MLLPALRTICNRVRYHYLYPHAAIHPMATVSTNVLVGNSARIECAVIVADSSLAENVLLGASCNVQSSIIGVQTTIYSNCCLHKVTCENNVTLYHYGKFSEVSIGRYTYIANQALIGMTEIGRFCSIGPGLICGYGDHPADFASTSPVFFSTGNQCGVSFAEKNLFEERKQIKIGHDVWIGARVFVRDGVKVGNGAIIAAGSVVVKDVPSYAIVGGVPAKIIRYRFSEEIITKLLDLQWWEWSEESLRSAQPYISQSNILDFIEFASQRNS